MSPSPPWLLRLIFTLTHTLVSWLILLSLASLAAGLVLGLACFVWVYSKAATVFFVLVLIGTALWIRRHWEQHDQLQERNRQLQVPASGYFPWAEGRRLVIATEPEFRQAIYEAAQRLPRFDTVAWHLSQPKAVVRASKQWLGTWRLPSEWITLRWQVVGEQTVFVTVQSRSLLWMPNLMDFGRNAQNVGIFLEGLDQRFQALPLGQWQDAVSPLPEAGAAILPPTVAKSSPEPSPEEDDITTAAAPKAAGSKPEEPASSPTDTSTSSLSGATPSVFSPSASVNQFLLSGTFGIPASSLFQKGALPPFY
jgi:hypothetical protein